MQITVNGRPVAAARGQTVLSAALDAGVYIPHLCSHPDLEPQGGCKLCMVEIEGKSGLFKACETAAEENMVISSKAPEAEHVRRVALELMLAGHPHDCTSCKAYLNCELQALLQYTGVVHSRLRDVDSATARINGKNPLIVREMERCIRCGRCIRACSDMRGVDILRYNKKDGESYVGTEGDMPLADAGCRFCGACVAVCPTGALMDAEGVFRKDLPREKTLVPCAAECPAGIDIPAYLRFIAEEKYSEAVGVIREKVPFPHALGYVCNHRCQTACKREELNEAISIRDLKRVAVEKDTEQVWRGTGFHRPDTGRRVAVVGAGPAGLTAALYLKKLGHAVTVFERLERAGGMLTSGMPEYRIPYADVQHEIDYILSSGVRLECGRDIASVSELKGGGWDAVLVATGAPKGKKLSYLAGSELEGVYTAVELLRSVRLGGSIELGESAAVIGGGNVAFDCARTLVRMGKRVSLVCLEKGEAMLADREEIEEGEREGVEILDGHTNLAIEGSGGRVSGLRVQAVESFDFDENGRLRCSVVPDSVRTIDYDSVIFAAGQTTDLTPQFGLELNRFGYPVYDPESLATSAEGVFAAGDVLTGTKFVIDAIAAGRRAACEIDKYLGGDGQIDETLVPRKREKRIGRAEDFAAMARQTDAEREAGRCLQCDLRCDISPVKVWTQYGRQGGAI